MGVLYENLLTLCIKASMIERPNDNLSMNESERPSVGYIEATHKKYIHFSQNSHQYLGLGILPTFSIFLGKPNITVRLISVVTH